MAKHNTLHELFSAIANAIRGKTGSSDSIVADDFPSAIESISASGGDDQLAGVLDGTATEVSSDEVTKLRDYAFYYNLNIKNFNFPALITIGNGAFESCTNLEITELPSTLKSVGSYAFNNCERIALSSLPSGLINYGNFVFQGCSNLTITSIPPGTTVISAGLFRTCSNLESMSIPHGVTSIQSGAFRECSNLKEVSIPSTVNDVAAYTFMDCSNLTIIDMPVAVCKINANTFNGCSTLNTIILRSTTSICTLSASSVFTRTPFASDGSGGTVYVPEALIETYKTATNWSTLYAAGTCNFVAIEGSEYE